MKRKQQFVASDWLPLNAAFVRIGDSVGSPALAASDLHYALLGGLPSAYRSQDRDGKTHHGELSPDFWRQFTMTDTAGDPSRVRIVPASGKVMPSYAIFYFYVRRADFDQLYPTGKAKRQGDAAQLPRRLPGPRKYDWLAIAGEIARRCHDKSGHLSVPDKESDLVKDMLRWCRDHLSKEPSLTEMKGAVRRIFAALRQV